MEIASMFLKFYIDKILGFFVEKKRTISAEAKIIENSIFFDMNWYEINYPNSRSYPGGTVQHYMDVGWKSGASPGPYFDAQAYLSDYPDVAQYEDYEPLLHFNLHGQNEYRKFKKKTQKTQHVI